MGKRTSAEIREKIVKGAARYGLQGFRTSAFDGLRECAVYNQYQKTATLSWRKWALVGALTLAAISSAAVAVWMTL